MEFFKNMLWNIRGFFVRRGRMHNPWSLQKKIIAGVMSGVLVIGGSTGAVLAHHFSAEQPEGGFMVAMLNPPTMANVEVYEPTYVEIPNFVGMNLASDSLEKDLTLYFKSAESKARIEGVAFQVKLISPKNESYLTEYLDEIDRINKEIDAAKEDGTENDRYEGDDLEAPSASAKEGDTKVAGASHQKLQLTAAQVKTEDQIEEQKEEAENTISANFDELTIGEKLLLDKQIAIQSYATALTAVDGKNYVDDDSDGMIYINKIDSGKYVACMVPTGFYDPSQYATEVTVKDKVEYKKVENIKDKVKKNVEDEKPAEAAPQEAVLQDTVQFVESSKTQISGGFTEAKPAAIAPSVSEQNTAKEPFEKTARRYTPSLFASVQQMFALSTVRAAEINLNETSVTLKVGESKTVSVTGATVSAATPGDTSICTASYAGDSVTITGVSEGSTTVTVSGTATEGEAPAPKTINVTVEKNTVSAEATLTVPKNVTLYSKSGLNSISGSISSENLSGDISVSSSDSANVTATISGGNVVFTGKEGVASNVTATITYSAVCADGKTPISATTTVTLVGTNNPIKSADGKDLFVDKEGKTPATLANYKADGTFYVAGGKPEYKYTGWQTIDGKTYFYTKDGVAVTGDQVIQGVQYSFNGLGVLVPKEGIDVSKWQGNIDWATASSYINFAIIRCGYRGESSRGLAIDPLFSRNVQGAKANGVKIGLYFYSTAMSEAEAVEEASLAVQCAQQAGGLSLPIYIDMEAGCQAGLSNDQRTAICNAFCATVRNSGYSAGVYANKNWLTNKINTGAISGAEIWVAQYNTTCTYGGTKKMWQYSSKGSIPGISGYVDMNRRY
ncbi:Lyzozyme M1 (1,4-beta-N-acetylmuramidase), GH25 family [Lachnospiraceae bacterium XBD2001]|nr:Lyzozyme M1 (1,4-beta-N-acetylmuramidase), GH25 family [Lachnospiraceae bacterium XBD2001]